jgi:hypothetical protein
MLSRVDRVAFSWHGCVFAILKLIGLFAVCLAAAELTWIFQLWLAGAQGVSAQRRYNGDYFVEADWALIQIAHAHVFSIFAAPPPPRGIPLMMPLSLLIRGPALAVGAALHIITLHSHANVRRIHGVSFPFPHASDNIRYQVGAVVTLAAGVSAVVATMWYHACRRDRIAALVLGVSMLALPLAGSTLVWGHPEEFLMGALIIAFILAASRELWGLAAVMLGLAVATKQPAWLLIPTFPFLLPPGQRRRGLIIAAAVAAVLILPFALPHLSALIGGQSGQVGASAQQPVLASLWGIPRALGWANLSSSGRPLIILCAIILPLGVAARNHWKLSVTQGAAIIALVLLARSALDPFNISYYEYPAAAALLALEIHAWHSHSHPFLSHRKLARLNPVPILALLAGVLLWGVNANGFITQWLDGADADLVIFSLMFVLVNIIIAGPLLLIIGRKRVSFGRARARLYGGASLIAVVLLLIVSLGGHQSPNHRQVAPPPSLSLVAATPTRVAIDLAPKSAYWLGSATLEKGFYLRTSAVEENKGNIFLSLFDYGTSPSAIASVAVFTVNGISPATLPAEIKECTHPNKRCRSGSYDLRTPFGMGLVQRSNASNWVVHIPVGKETISVASLAPLPIAATVNKLQVVGVSTSVSSSLTTAP